MYVYVCVCVCVLYLKSLKVPQKKTKNIQNFETRKSKCYINLIELLFYFIIEQTLIVCTLNLFLLDAIMNYLYFYVIKLYDFFKE